MRTNDVLDPTVVTGGDLASSGVHLGRELRVGDVTADLAAAGVAAPGTLDGSLTCIQAGAHGVSVSYRAPDARRAGAS